MNGTTIGTGAESRTRPAEILLVEDNPGDIRLTREALRELPVPTLLRVVTDGAAALDYVFNRGEYPSAPAPDLILLDLNLPKKHGFEVLDAIKQSPAHRRIPVIVLSTSSARADIARSYDLHANCYITKPLGLDRFFTMMKLLEAFWFTVATLETRHER
jgi:two-component system, chemotaxis family, response regulator Rcp1